MATARDFAKLIDPECGIITKVSMSRKPLWFSDLKFASAFSNQWPGITTAIKEERSHPTPRSKETRSAFWKSASISVGVGYDPESALIRAVAEGVERFCAQIVTEKTHTIYDATLNELSGKFPMLSAEDYQYLQDWQYVDESTTGVREIGAPVYKLRSDESIRWIEVDELTEGVKSAVPVLAGFLGIRPKRSKERVIEQISTGMACHGTREAAIVSGLSEIIERDAFVGMWLRRLSPPRVSLDTVRTASPTLSKMITELGRTTFSLALNDITSDLGVPAFLATATSDIPPYVVVGASAHPNAVVAAEKAIFEVLMALAGHVESTYLSDGSDFWKVLEEGQMLSDDDITQMKDHSELYAKNDLRARLSFYLEAPEVSFRGQTFLKEGLDDAPAQFERLREALKAAGLKVYVNDLTIPEVASVGLCVVKVFVPTLIPLYCLERNKPLACRRLWGYHEIFPQRVTFEETINPWAHPFP